MLSENSWYIIVISVIIAVNYCKCMLLLYSPLNSYLYVHWILDVKSILLVLLHLALRRWIQHLLEKNVWDAKLNRLTTIMSYLLLHRVIKLLSSIVLHTVSLNCRRSSKEQECARSGHSNICLVFSDEKPQSHDVLPKLVKTYSA